MTKPAIIWSSEHTLGHIAISADNPIAKYFKKENAEQQELPCDLVEAGKFRNGNKRWWCRTHQIHFGVKGEQLENPSCRNAKMLLDYCTNPLEIDPRDYPGGVGIWAALPPVIDTSNEAFSIGIHVHLEIMTKIKICSLSNYSYISRISTHRPIQYPSRTIFQNFSKTMDFFRI